MDRSIPTIPGELLPSVKEEYWLDEILNLWHAVLTELECEEYISRSHHNTGTHDAGCRGPLCKKAYREHPRRKASESSYTPRKERIYDPILEYYHTVAKLRIREDQKVKEMQ